MKKTIILWVVIFILGTVAGFYLGKKGQTGAQRSIQIVSTASENGIASAVVSDKINLAKLKLDLLKNYTDLVLLSPEKNADVAKYADNINKGVEAINDPEISSRLDDTVVGDENTRSQKVNAFLDFLNDKIKADLQ